MIRYVVVSLIACIASAGASAQQLYRSDSPGGTGQLAGFSNTDVPFNNFFKTVSITPTGQNPPIFDIDGYPNNGTTPASIIGGNLTLPPDFCNYHWIVDWQGTLGSALHPGFRITRAAPGGGFTIFSGSSFVTGGSSPGSTMDLFGTNGAVEFSFSGNTCNTYALKNYAASLVSTATGWLPNATSSGLKNMRLYRCSSQTGYKTCADATAALNANVFGGFNPDFINEMLALRPGWLRFLGGIGTNSVASNLSSFKYRILPTSFSYESGHFDPGSWVGEITCPYTSGANCNSDAFATTTGPSSPTDGMLIQGYLQASNVTNAPTLTLNGGATYPIINPGGQASFTASISDGGGACNAGSTYSGVAGTCMIVSAVGSGTLTAGALVYGLNVLPGTTIVSQPSGTTGGVGSYIVSQSLNITSATQATSGLAVGALVQNATFTATWDASMKAWISSLGFGAGGFVNAGIPFEVEAALANQVNAHIWFNIPGFLAQDGSMQSIASLFLSNLNSQLNFGTEFCNEVWNPSYNCTDYAQMYGQSVLGLTVSGDNTINGYYAIKSKQYFDNVMSAWGSSPRFYGILAAQFYGGNWSGYRSNRFEGGQLCGTTCGNATYQATIGHDYNASPNRPVDEARMISGAPYLQGSVCNYANQSPYNTLRYQQLTGNFASLATAADQWAAGNTSAAFTALFNDITGSSTQILQGTHSVFTLTDPIQTNAAVFGATFTGNASGTTTLTVSGATSNTIMVGAYIFGTGVPAGTMITAYGTGSGGNGTYTTSVPLTLSNVTVGYSQLQFAQIGSFTGNTGGVPSTTVTVTAPTAVIHIGALLQPNGNVPVGTTVLSGPAGGGAGTYTVSNPVTLSSASVQFTGSWLSNWQQLATDMTATAGRTIYFGQYEGAQQCTGPMVSDCNNMAGNGLGGKLAASPQYYCGNSSGPNGDVLVSGYQVGDVLSSTANSLSGFSYVVDTIAPDGTPLTGHVSAVGSGMTASATNVALSGGNGFNISADITESGGSVTGVTLYSQVVTEMIYAWLESSSFQTLEQNAYTIMQDAVNYPSTLGVANSDLSGNTPFTTGNPWAMYLGTLYGTKLGSWFAFQHQNGGSGGFLLKRDLGHGNDNSPAFINRAA